MEELEAIVQRMIDSGESNEKIKETVRLYKEQNPEKFKTEGKTNGGVTGANAVSTNGASGTEESTVLELEDGSSESQYNKKELEEIVQQLIDNGAPTAKIEETVRLYEEQNPPPEKIKPDQVVEQGGYEYKFNFDENDKPVYHTKKKDSKDWVVVDPKLNENGEITNPAYMSIGQELGHFGEDAIDREEYLNQEGETEEVSEVEPAEIVVEHMTADQMKDGVSWLQAEGDFVSNMNEYYEKYGIEFKEASGMQDEFVMYDSNTDETSRAFSVPNIVEKIMPSLGLDHWEIVRNNVVNFIDREKIVDVEFQEQKTKASNIIANKLDDSEFITNLLGEDYNFEYAERLERGGKGEDYEIVMKALKNEIGEFGGFFGGSFSTDVDFANMSEQLVESVIANAITKKREKEKALKSNEYEVDFAAKLKYENLTETKIDIANKQSKKNALSKEESALYEGLEKIKKLEPGTEEYEAQQKKNKALLLHTEKWYQRNSEFLIDPITGISVNPESPEAAGAVIITYSDLEKTEEKIKLTYGGKIERAFNVNGRKKWYSDKRGEEVFNITVNDPQALAVFRELGYKTTGDNKNGYELDVKLKHLARYYDATVKSDGFSFFDIATLDVAPEDQKKVGRDRFLIGGAASLMGFFGIADKASFESPQGFFGLTEKTDEQEFTLGEQRFFEEEEYSDDDKSKAFKRMLKDYRDERFDIIKQGKVLTKMHLLNTDPASIEDLPGTRGFELVAEGFEGMFGGSQTDTDLMTSQREAKDILEVVAGEYNIPLTKTQTEAIKRSGGYRIYEGVSGFVPAIAEFALIDLVIKKGVGVIPGAAKLISAASKGTTGQRALYHTYGIIKEELKMKQAFDEHYHLGGGAGFYAVGAFLPNFKSKYNLLNTFMNANKSGFGGALSAQAAMNLEALARDVAGKESYQTFIKENYNDLELTTEDFLVDYFVFGIVGAKGWAAGGKNWKNNFRTTSKLERLESELADKVTIYNNVIKNRKATGKSYEDIQAKLDKAHELFLGVHSKLEGIYDMNDWQDPEKATKILERQGKNIKAIFGEDVSIEAINERVDPKTGKSRFQFDNSAAEFSTDGKTILVDVNKCEPGKMPHEVFHLTMERLFKNNKELMNDFQRQIESKFQGKIFADVGIRDKDGKLTGKTRNMTIEELVKNEHGHQRGGKTDFDNIKSNEFLAYVAEVLSNPRYYSKLTANNTWKKLQMDINKFTNRHMGINAIESGTKQDLIDFMANFSRSVMSGTLTRKQVLMFKKMKSDNVYAESIEADSRVPRVINEAKSEAALKTAMPSKSVELSSKTQKVYDDIIKDKEGRQLDRAVDQMLTPDFKNPTSVAGENFDNIIYDLIKDMYPEVHKNKDQKYTLALDMVYDLNRSPGAKNRGVQGIIKDYAARESFGVTNERPDIYDSEGNKRLTKKQVTELESKYNAKFGTPEFIKQAEAGGYKGKQNVTKTVREMLIKRIHEMKESAFGQESDFAGLGYTKSVEEMSAMGMDIVDTKSEPFEFKSEYSGSKPIRKINPLDYVNSRDLVAIRNNTTKFLKSKNALIDLRPSELAKAVTPKTKNILEKQFGRVEEVVDSEGNITYRKVAKKNYYDIQKSVFQEKEKALYEMMLPESRDRYTSETTNAARSAFDSVYEPVGKFSFAELNEGIASELLTRSQKAEGRMKMVKKPYKKGILNDIIFKGDRKDAHHKKIDYLMSHGAFTLSRKVLNDQLNNPRFAELLKSMNPGVYEGIQFDQVLNSVKENLRGTTPDALASVKVKTLVDEYAKKIRGGQGARPAMLEIIAKYEELKPYKDDILREMNLGIDDIAKVTDLFVKVGEAGRLIGSIKGESTKLIIFDSKFDGKKGDSVHKEIFKFVEKQGLDKAKLNIDQTKKARENDPVFMRQFYEEFLPSLFNIFDARLLNLKGKDRGGLGTTIGVGDQRPGYRKLVDHIGEAGIVKGKRHMIVDAAMRDGFFEGLEGIEEINPKTKKPYTDKEFTKEFFDPNFVKVNNNTKVQGIVDKALALDRFKDVYNPENTAKRKELSNYVKKQLSPDKTLEGYSKMLKSNEGMLGYISEKIFDYVSTAKNKEQAINNMSYFLQMQTNLGNGWFRGLASHNAMTLHRSGNPELSLSKRYRSEHELQLVNFTGNLLMNSLHNSGNKKAFKGAIKPLIREFKQSIISKRLQEKIDSPELGGSTTNVMKSTDIMAKSNYLLDRSIMESMMDINSGKTYVEIIDNALQSGAGYRALKVVSEKTNLPSKNVTTTEMLRNIKIRDHAFELGRKKDKVTSSMSAWDLDGTLLNTKSGVRYTLPNPSGKPQPGRKVIFLAGGAGSGKSGVVKSLKLEAQGFKIVNQDISLEWLKENAGLPTDMRDLTPEQLSEVNKLAGEARRIAKRKQGKFKGKGDGVIIDGTGGSLNVMNKKVQEFKDAGYDVQMIFVDTSLDIALERNANRKERSLSSIIVKQNHKAVQSNKQGFKELFGDRFAEVNTDNLPQGSSMPESLTSRINDFVSGYKKARLDAGEFATEGAELKRQGAEFDFSEFTTIKEGKQGPFFQKALARAKKYGTKDTYVLTARPQEAAGPIHEFLKSLGLDIPLENITGLGRSEGEAKALWMLEKFAEGYNDMYFADDALQNVKAVKKVLDQLDIKSKVQLALASKNVSLDVNKIMEHSLGIKSEKTFSQAESKVIGANIKRRRIFMTDSAADLELLLEPLYGKGDKGIENKKWFGENFIRVFERDYNDLNNARQKAAEGYLSLRKQNKEIVKSLDKPVGDTNFSGDMAIRVYIWNKNGLKIPGLDKQAEAKLVEHVKNNPELQAFAENAARLTGSETGLREPSSSWWAETIAGEMGGQGEGIGRKKYLQNWIDVKNEIFSEENLNKMETKLGTDWRKNLEDMFGRMETGSARPSDLGEHGEKMMDFLNGSVGTIMHLNTRSGVLQLISSVNFINHDFNNPFLAAKAFANAPQYWKDFKYILNSDMLKQRRSGLQINVTEAELAAAASGSKNKPKAVLAWILKQGYLPTKVCDSFAIASGGATFYRNAIKKYTKEGLSKSEAERKAWIDFQAVAERTQQSARPDLLSAQQTSLGGRVILPFANTPMQMNRIMMKELLDIKNGRYEGFTGDGSFTHKMSKIGYYGFAQSALFAGLQSGLFALLLFSDDDELIAKKKVHSVNTIADSFLRGMGIQGAVIAGLKNAILEFQAQNEKGWGADYDEVGEDLLNISPTVGSKFSKLDAAGNTYMYNKKEIGKEGLTLRGPKLEALTQAAEAVLNIPTNRAHKKISNISEALNKQNAAWQRILVGLGWSQWDVGIGQRKAAESKEERAEDTKERRELKKEETKKAKEAEKKKEEEAKKAEGFKSIQCSGIKSNGQRCSIMVETKAKSAKCSFHKAYKPNESSDRDNDGIKEYQCKSLTGSGKRCKNRTENTSKKCYAHQ